MISLDGVAVYLLLVVIGAATAAGSDSAGEGTAVNSLDDQLGPFIPSRATGRPLMLVGAGLSIAGATLVTLAELSCCGCVSESMGAEYCCLKLLADVDGHMPEFASMWGRLDGSEAIITSRICKQTERVEFRKRQASGLF